MASDARDKRDLAGFLPHDRLDAMLGVLRAVGYRVVGPQVRDGAIVYDTLDRASQLPSGVRDAQAPGRYRLNQESSTRRFAWANGPQALKPLLFRPRQSLWQCDEQSGGLRFHLTGEPAEPLAVLGVRACDLAALQLQDQHFLGGLGRDPHYSAQREQLLLIAVNCTHPAATCFCASTGDGPRAERGADIALSELDAGFIVEAMSEAGQRLVRQFPLDAVTDTQCTQADRDIEQAVARQQRRLPETLREQLRAIPDHPRWNEVAARCLACGNCTAVCPTCFCHREIDSSALDGRRSEHVREWDSCFTQQHSYIHGLTIRADTRTRYRQWLTHKLDSWFDQYGRSGCVGCGRCITWCPVGIDLTEEAAALVAGNRDG